MLGLRSQCCLYALVVDQAFVLFVRRRTTYISCPCTSCDGDNASPLKKALLLTSRGDTAPYLTSGGDTAPYFMCRHYSIVIASGPEVAFVTQATPADRSNIELFCLKNIRS
ncbi:hypothetical protein Tco_0919854 [Tanacetum coccineum]